MPVYAGTDAGGGIRHGRIVDEVAALHAAGVPRRAGRGELGGRGRGWAGLRWSRGRRRTWSSTATTRARTPTALRHPELVLLRGRPFHAP